MPTFFESDLSLPSFWRSIILYGKNTASYKFALAKSLIELSKNNNDLIKIDDLAVPFSKNLCNHLKVNENLRSNTYWQTLMEISDQKKQYIERSMNIDLVIKSITVRDVSQLAKKYLDDNYLRQIELINE